MKKYLLCGLVLMFLALIVPRTSCLAYDFPVIGEAPDVIGSLSVDVDIGQNGALNLAGVIAESNKDGTTNLFAVKLNKLNVIAQVYTACNACHPKVSRSRLSDKALYSGFA